MEKNKLDLLSENLFKINLDLDTLRTNINVSLFYMNELMRDAKNKKDDKENWWGGNSQSTWKSHYQQKNMRKNMSV